MSHNRRRRPIQKKVLTMCMIISSVALVLTSAVGIVSMVRIQGKSRVALTTQMEQNMQTIVTSKADLADAVLGRYAGYVGDFARYINELYTNPQKYPLNEVFPPNARNAGSYSMQRSLLDRSVSLDSVKDEMMLLGGLERVWHNVVPENNNIITTVYAATESGFMLSYDRDPVPPVDGETEIYFDHKSTSWYRIASAVKDNRDSGITSFTNVYQDAIGRGLTISCAAPFFNAEGRFAGVVCMDILISNLYETVLDLDLGDGSYAFLVDRMGNLIELSSSGVTDMRNIYYDDKEIGYRIASRVLRGKTGVTLSKRGMYYAYAPISITGWKFGIRVPQSIILASIAPINETMMNTMFQFVVAFILIVVMIFVAARRFSALLTGPIAALENDVMEISSGNLDYRADVYDNDEIGDLAMSFNNMASSLKGYIKTFASVTAERERIGAELDIARKLQADMLPQDFPPFPDRSEFDIYASMTPAKEVGGDFYDFFLIDGDHLAMVIADVSGKGVPAALFMVTAKTLLKSRAQMGGSPSDILEDVSSQLCESNEAEFFVTVWLGILEISTGRVTASNAGHEDPAIMRNGETYSLLRTRHSPAVAMAYGLTFREDKFELRPGDSIYLYTDGVTEAMDTERELYGTERMIDALNRHSGEAAGELLASMKRDVETFVRGAPQFDDITMLSMHYYGKKGGLNGESWDITVEARTENLSYVFDFLKEHLDECGCSPRSQAQIKLAAEEIFVNVANYAYNPDVGIVTIRLEVKDDVATITFIDGGVPYDPLSRPDPDITLPIVERSIGGLGIYMAKKSMDNVQYEYRDGQNVLRMQKRFREGGTVIG